MTKIVKKGNTGELVYQVQEKLASAGYSIKPDYDFGEKTEKVLKEYQVKHKLTADGVAGPQTLKQMEIVDITKAQLAASFAKRNAQAKSVGLCAKYVANAFEAAWYKFNRQSSAYMYDTKGVMEAMGFSRMSSGTIPRVGDVIVVSNSALRAHGHIQIYDGRFWNSDFAQKGFLPYPEKIAYSFWRDMSRS